MSRHSNQASLPEVFHSRYVPEPNTGCWLWLGSTALRGYGQLSVSYKSVLAHRLSWELHFGPIPTGLSVCHKCDVPSCVNPQHLFVGTPAENSHDMVRKGRSRSGERHPRAKLTRAQAEEMRVLMTSGMSTRRVAQQFGVTQRLAVKISHGDIWKGDHG